MKRILCVAACALSLVFAGCVTSGNPLDTEALNAAIKANIAAIEVLTGEPLVDPEKIAEVQKKAGEYFAAIDAVIANLRLFGVEVDPDILAQYKALKTTIASLSFDVIDDPD